VESLEIWILHTALGVILQADEQMSPRHVVEIAMVAAGFPSVMTELQQHLAVVLRFEDEFLRRANPIQRAAAGAFPAHERGRRQLLDAHLESAGMLKEAEDRLAAGAAMPMR
jgi:hypothetical protein